MTSVRRFIRLKEHSTDASEWTPTDTYMKVTDGTLEQRPYAFEIDEHRFIATGVPTDPSFPSIFVLGDSFVESSFADPDKRFVAQMAKNLDGFNVFNAGYSGTTSIQLLVSLIAKIAGIAKDGDIVVLCAPMSDSSSLLETSSFWNESPRYAPVLPGFTGSSASWSDQVTPLLSTAVHFCQQLGLGILLVTSPFREADFNTDLWYRTRYKRNRENYHKNIAMMRSLQDATRQFAEENNVPLLDLALLLGHDSSLFYDELHLNAKGQDYVAGIFTEAFTDPEILASINAGKA